MNRQRERSRARARTRERERERGITEVISVVTLLTERRFLFNTSGPREWNPPYWVISLRQTGKRGTKRGQTHFFLSQGFPQSNFRTERRGKDSFSLKRSPQMVTGKIRKKGLDVFGSFGEFLACRVSVVDFSWAGRWGFVSIRLFFPSFFSLPCFEGMVNDSGLGRDAVDRDLDEWIRISDLW